MSQEDWMLARIDQRRETGNALPPFVERAYLRATDTFRRSEYSVREDSFASVRRPEDIKADRARVQYMQKQFAARDAEEFHGNSARLASIFEAVLLEEARDNQWFGDAHVLKTADYDDFVNKIDMIAEWTSPEAGSQMLGIGVDVTYSADAIHKKLSYVRQELDNGRLGTIKYVLDAKGNPLPSRQAVPRIIIGADRSVVEGLAKLWVEERGAELAMHPIQHLCLIEIDVQLREGLARAQRLGNEEIVATYEQAYAVVNPLRQAKKSMELGPLNNDRVALEIINQTKRLFQE